MVDRTLTLYTEDGKEILADVVFTYNSEEFNHDYVVFQLRETKEISAAIYIPEGDGAGHLEKIETEEEWQLLEELLNDYNSEQVEGGCASCSGGCAGCGSSCGGDCDCNGDCNQE